MEVSETGGSRTRPAETAGAAELGAETAGTGAEDRRERQARRWTDPEWPSKRGAAEPAR